MAMKRQTNLALPVDLVERLDAAAAADRRDRSSMATVLLERAFAAGLGPTLPSPIGSPSRPDPVAGAQA